MLKNVQFLRAIAAAAVVMAHVDSSLMGKNSTLNYGVAGVDLFFVISGFIMAHITFARETQPAEFIMSRAIRIVPLYWAMTVAMFAVAMIMPSKLGNSTADPSELIKSLLFIPFEKSPGVLQPTLFLGWTLNYEIFFYVLFATALFVRNAFWRLTLIVLSLVLLTVIGRVVASDSIFFRFYTDPIVLEFCYGIGIAVLLKQLTQRQVSAFWPWVLVATALLIATVLLGVNRPSTTLSGRELFFGVPAALLVLAALLFEHRGVKCESRILLLVGAASYSLYLSHPFVFVPAAQLRGFVAPGTFVTLLWGVATFIACIVGAILLYQLIERPVTAYLHKIVGDRKWREAHKRDAPADPL